MPLTVNVEVPPRDREVLASWVRSPSIRAGLAQRARIVLLAADGLGTNEIARRTGVSKPTVIAWKKRYAAEGTRRAGGPAEAGQAADHRRCGDRAGHAGAAAGAAGGDALVEPAAGRRAGPVEREGRQGVAGVRAAAVAHRERSSSPPTRSWRPRSATSSGSTSTRRTRPWCCAWMKNPRPRRWNGPRRCCRCGPGSPKSAATTTSGTAPPRCSPPWRSPPARSPTPATPATGTRSSCGSCARSPRPTRAASCTSWPTTTAPTSTRTSGPGWPDTPGSPCTSPRRRGPG